MLGVKYFLYQGKINETHERPCITCIGKGKINRIKPEQKQKQEEKRQERCQERNQQIHWLWRRRWREKGKTQSW